MGIASFFSKFLPLVQKFFNTTKTTLKNVLVLVLVFGLERIFEKDVFQCPSTRYFMYGNLFLFGPGVCLFSLTLLLNNTFWDVVTGCCLAHFSRRWVAKNLARILFQALLPPGVWIVVALIQTQYYVCLRLGPKQQALTAALKANNGSTIEQVKARVEEEYGKARTESHIFAWVLFDGLVVLAFLAVCVRRCLCMRAEGNLPDLEQYDKLEAKSAAEEFKSLMEEQAEKEGKNFVNVEFKNAKGSTDNDYEQLELVREKVLKHYPRSAGDLSKPYRVDIPEKEMPYRVGKSESEMAMNSVYANARMKRNGNSNEMIETTSAV